jgi:hypothetical protein
VFAAQVHTLPRGFIEMTSAVLTTAEGRGGAEYKTRQERQKQKQFWYLFQHFSSYRFRFLVPSATEDPLVDDGNCGTTIVSRVLAYS